MKARIKYLGPWVSFVHRSPDGISRTFWKDKWFEDDLSEKEYEHYTTSGGFQVEKVTFLNSLKNIL